MDTPARKRWRELEQLLDAALDLRAEERGAFLDRACGSDAELRRDLERLVHSCEAAQDFLQEPAPAFAAPPSAQSVRRRPARPARGPVCRDIPP